MTPRFILDTDVDTLGQWAGIPPFSLVAVGFHPQPRFVGMQAVLRRNAAGKREMVWMREGLVPSYAYDDHGAEQRTEAHVEALNCDSCFRSAFRRRRCIVPATLLQEERHLGQQIEQPCTLVLDSGNIFGIAAVWETWINDQGHSVESFAIVTSLVMPSLRSLFDRMPVILGMQPTRNAGSSEMTSLAHQWIS